MNAWYIPIVCMFVLAAGFVIVSIGLSLVVGPRRYNRAKYDSYECGIQPTPSPEDGGKIPIKYYITAMLFIVFDIEIVFLYPWAVFYDKLGLFALVEMFLFVIPVFISYVYVLRRKGLKWE